MLAADYRTWTNAVKQEDKLLRQDLVNACSVSLTVLAAGSRPRADMVPSTRSTSSTPAPSPLPAVKLSDEEKKILSNHDGCFKCRRPYAGHRTHECPNGFPDKYEHVMTAMAEAIRAQRNRVAQPQRPIAAVLDAFHLDDHLPSTVLGSGSEESDDSSF